MVSFTNKNNLLSLFLLGSLFVPAFSQVDKKQNLNLRRKTQSQLPCSPFVGQRSVQDRFTFLLLEFEKLNLNTEYAPYINGTAFTEAYNSITPCSQIGAYRFVEGAAEFHDGSALAARAEYRDADGSAAFTGTHHALLQFENFYCNSCGEEDFKVFFDESGLVGEADIAGDVCDCRGPTVDELVGAVGLPDLVNATQIPLLSPEDCVQTSRTTYSYEGVCPGLLNPAFLFFSTSPSEVPTETPTKEPTDEPTDSPTEQPTVEPTDSPTEEPTEEPTYTPTESTPKPTRRRVTRRPTPRPVVPTVPTRRPNSTRPPQPPTRRPDSTRPPRPDGTPVARRA